MRKAEFSLEMVDTIFARPLRPTDNVCVKCKLFLELFQLPSREKFFHWEKKKVTLLKPESHFVRMFSNFARSFTSEISLKSYPRRWSRVTLAFWELWQLSQWIFTRQNPKKHETFLLTPTSDQYITKLTAHKFSFTYWRYFLKNKLFADYRLAPDTT